MEITVNGSTRAYDIAGRQHVLVPWPGDPIPSRARVSWRVRVATESGEHHWSEPAAFTTGLAPEDWTADWIGPAEPSVPEAGNRPAYLLRRAFSLKSGIRRATAYATAHGIYELFVNGNRIGDAELTPGYTSYRKYLHVQAYDVSRYLQSGENVVGAVLSDGWFRGRTGYYRTPDCFGDETAFLCQLEIEAADGSVLTVTTDGEWSWSTGSIVAADLMDGQRVDYTLAKPGWSKGAGDGFEPVVVRSGDSHTRAVVDLVTGAAGSHRRVAARPRPDHARRRRRGGGLRAEQQRLGPRHRPHRRTDHDRARGGPGSQRERGHLQRPPPLGHPRRWACAGGYDRQRARSGARRPRSGRWRSAVSPYHQRIPVREADR